MLGFKNSMLLDPFELGLLFLVVYGCGSTVFTTLIDCSLKFRR